MKFRGTYVTQLIRDNAECRRVFNAISGTGHPAFWLPGGGEPNADTYSAVCGWFTLADKRELVTSFPDRLAESLLLCGVCGPLGISVVGEADGAGTHYAWNGCELWVTVAGVSGLTIHQPNVRDLVCDQFKAFYVTHGREPTAVSLTSQMIDLVDRQQRFIPPTRDSDQLLGASLTKDAPEFALS